MQTMKVTMIAGMAELMKYQTFLSNIQVGIERITKRPSLTRHHPSNQNFKIRRVMIRNDSELCTAANVARFLTFFKL